MSQQPYLTAPPATTAMPPGVPYIVANEAAERFSYYGMRAILYLYMTKYLLDAQGQKDVMTEDQAKMWVALFQAAVYAFPLIGALIADALWGKYRTIMNLSIVYCLGHLALALDDTRLGLAIGLGLIAIGSGGIKPCVSANVGDQFGPSNQHLMQRVYGWFYLSINFGSAISTVLTPWLRTEYGPRVAFSVPGVLMLVATIAFWAGRGKFVHIPPGGKSLVREAFGRDGLRSLGKMAILVPFVAIFWSLYGQGDAAWVEQAEHMDRYLFGWVPEPDAVHFVNPVLILIYLPLFERVIYPAINRVFLLNPLRKLGIGFFVTVIAGSLAAWNQSALDAGQYVHIAWQMLGWVVLTAAEVMVSVTCLEFFYTQATPRMKSIVMSVYLLSVSFGNQIIALVNYVIQNPDGSSKLEGASYYWFFVAIMIASAIVYLPVAMRFPLRTYLQSEQPPK